MDLKRMVNNTGKALMTYRNDVPSTSLLTETSLSMESNDALTMIPKNGETPDGTVLG